MIIANTSHTLQFFFFRENNMKRLSKIVFTLLLYILSSSAFAIPISWVDWQTSSDNFSAHGELFVDATTVDVEYSATGAHSFVTTGAGTNYWASGSPYTNGTVDNAPPASDIIALNTGGIITLTFSETVVNPYIALVSWNSNTVEFGTDIVIDSFGAGHWGSGTPILNGSGTGFFGSGEVHGVIYLTGSFDEISFSHTSEGWHGFTLGVAGLGDEGEDPEPSIPEPNVLILFGLGLFTLIFYRRVYSRQSLFSEKARNSTL